MTKEEFTNIYNKEMKELSYVESSIDELGFQMDGVVNKHNNCLWAFERYARNHQLEKNNGFYYGYIANRVVDVWDKFMSVCFELWNFLKMSKGSLEQFYTEKWQDRCHPLGWLCELPHHP